MGIVKFVEYNFFCLFYVKKIGCCNYFKSDQNPEFNVKNFNEFKIMYKNHILYFFAIFFFFSVKFFLIKQA